MSQNEPTNDKLPSFDRILQSIRVDARKMSEVCDRMEEDAEKMESAGRPAPAALVRQSVTTVRVALEHLRGAFRVEW